MYRKSFLDCTVQDSTMWTLNGLHMNQFPYGDSKPIRLLTINDRLIGMEPFSISLSHVSTLAQLIRATWKLVLVISPKNLKIAN